MSLTQRLAGLGKVAGILLSLLLLAAGAAAEYLTGGRYPMLVLFLAASMLAGWSAGTGPGLVAALAGAGASAFAAMRAGPPPSLPALAWSAVTAAVVLGAAAVSARSLRRAWARDQLFSHTDQLTGVANMNYFMEQAQAEFRRARRSRQPLSVAYIDIDNLKEINDLLGFLHGDRLLRAFAVDLRNHTRSSDIIARLGGDEFIILFPETGVDQARGAAGKIHKSFQTVAEREECHATLTIALVTVFNPESKLDDVLKQASDLLLQAKGDGGNTVRDAVAG